MNPDELRSYLNRRQVKFEEKKVAHGTQFRCAGGDIFMVYNTGTVVPQGKVTDLGKDVLQLARGGKREVDITEETAEASQQVFIVYGHDIAARDNLELVLHRMGLDPIVLQNVAAAGDTVIEKLERYLGEHGNVGFACVLLTPDDEGYKAGKPEEKKYRARQNVILELGMVLARVGRRRVAILHKESVELPSDIAGLIYIPFKERVDEVTARLFRELQEAGYSPRSEAL